MKESFCNKVQKDISSFFSGSKNDLWVFFKTITPCINWKYYEKEEQRKNHVALLKQNIKAKKTNSK